MKLEIEATEKITDIEGVPVRLWNGVTEQGVECLVFVHRIAVKNTQEQSQFEAELKEMPAPTEPISLRNIL